MLLLALTPAYPLRAGPKNAIVDAVPASPFRAPADCSMVRQLRMVRRQG
jgi:hypothetical protein